MKRLASLLLWSILFCAALYGTDRFLVHVAEGLPPLAEVRTFYLDFRTRLLRLAGCAEEASLEKVIDGAAAPAPSADSPRYLYVDKNGELQFADSLEEVPAALRGSAQPLAR